MRRIRTVLFAAMLFAATTTPLYAQISWSKVYSNTNIVGSMCEISNTLFAVAGNRVIIKSTNKGASWTSVTPVSGFPPISYNAIDAYGSNLYMTNCMLNPYRGKGFLVSTDQGLNWTVKNNGLGTDTLLIGLNITLNGTIFVTAVNHISTGNDSYKLYRSVDGGNNWTYNMASIYGFSIVENSKGIYYLMDGAYMYTSTNSGLSWTKLTQTTVVSSGVAIASNDSMYVLSGQSILHSKDGIDWKSRSTTGWPASQYPSNWLITPNDTIFAGIDTTPNADMGVYMSPDLGKTWTKINTGLATNPQILPGAVCFNKSSGYLFVSPNSSNLWRTTTPVYTPGITPPPLSTIDYSDKYNLMISPNPAVNATRISYTLNTSDAVTIEITDNTGKSIKTITSNETQSSGLHEPMIDISGMRPGMYLISVRSASGGSVKKLVVN